MERWGLIIALITSVAGLISWMGPSLHGLNEKGLERIVIEAAYAQGKPCYEISVTAPLTNNSLMPGSLGHIDLVPHVPLGTKTRLVHIDTRRVWLFQKLPLTWVFQADFPAEPNAPVYFDVYLFDNYGHPVKAFQRDDPLVINLELITPLVPESTSPPASQPL